MRKYLNKLVFVLILVFALLVCVSCGNKEDDKKEEKTDLEIAYEAKIDSPTSYVLKTEIKEGTVSVYEETMNYVKGSDGYNGTGSKMYLNDLTKEEEYTTIDNEKNVSTYYQIEFKEKTFENAEAKDGVFKAGLTGAATTQFIGEDATNAKIEATYANGKINSIKLTAEMNGQFVSIEVTYTY